MKNLIEITETLYQIFMILMIVAASKEIKMGDVLLSLTKYVKNQKLLFFIYSNMIGFLPIPGRITATCGLNDILLKTKNEKLSYLSYVSTHHYYLWSPAEKSVIILLSGLSITYGQFLHYSFPLILSYFILLFVSYIYYLNTNDIEINYNFEEQINSKSIFISVVTFFIILSISIYFKSFSVFLFFSALAIFYMNKLNPIEIVKKIDKKLISLVAVVMILGIVAKNYINVNMLKDYHFSFYIFLFVSFFLSLILGSSSKYSAIVVIGCIMYGIDKLPILLLNEFVGYLLSPIHKCNAIACIYFGTHVVDYYKRLFIFSLLFVLISSVMIVTYLQ